MKFLDFKKSYLLQGWFTLHVTALARGAQAPPDDDWGPPLIYPENYLAILHPLPVLFGVLPEDYDYSEPAIKRAMGDALIRLISEHSPLLLEQFFSHPGESIGALVLNFNKTDLDPFAIAPLNPRNPHGVARKGFALIKEAEPNLESLPTIAWGIALIGWAKLMFSYIDECLFCPRRTAPRSKYCYEHGHIDLSSDNSHNRSPSKQYVKHRAGKKARQLADARGVLKRTLLSPYYKHIHDVVTMANILDPAIICDPTHEIAQLNANLKASPRVVSKLGGQSIFSLEYRVLTQKIIEVLTPFQDSENFLSEYVSRFELWFELEESVQPGKRGVGMKTATNVEQAILMATQGAKQVEIAKALDVGVSTVSMWAKKYPDFRELIKNKKINL